MVLADDIIASHFDDCASVAKSSTLLSAAVPKVRPSKTVPSVVPKFLLKAVFLSDIIGSEYS